jgi:hypothetical protein
MDEYPYHQITESFAAVQGSDPQWNDGHYVCVADLDGVLGLTSNLRLYQNNDVLDGFVCVTHAGRQHNIRLSRRLRPDMDSFAVGPLRIDIVEPMRTLRMVLDENRFGIACDITCHSRTVPNESAPEITRVDGRLLSERTTYEIAGQVEGVVEVGGERLTLDPARASFFRNHSWGFMGGRGGPKLYAAPRVGVPRRPAGLRQWVLYAMPDHCGFYHCFDDPTGRRTMQRGNILHTDRAVPVTAIDHHLEFYADDDGSPTRRLQRGNVTLTDADGVERTFTVEDLGCWVYCQGGGYFGGFDDGLGQGVYRGDYHDEGEVWDVSHPTRIVRADGHVFEHDHAWAENFTRFEADGQAGLAHFECVVFA